jgi:hypothetical protein
MLLNVIIDLHSICCHFQPCNSAHNAVATGNNVIDWLKNGIEQDTIDFSSKAEPAKSPEDIAAMRRG